MAKLNPQTRRTALIIAGAGFMQILDGAILNTSLPQMAAGLGVAPVQMSVGITTYMMVLAVFMPLSAWLAERFSSLRVFLGAILIFTFGSLLCGLSQNILEFALARALQAVGGALLLPVGQIIMLRQATRAELLEANNFITWPALTAPIIGPILGGFITTYLGWRWNFFVNLPIGAAGMWIAWRFLKVNHERVIRPLDWHGFALTALALAFSLQGLEMLGQFGHSARLPWGLIVLGMVSGVFALRHLRRAKAPLLDLGMFRHPCFRMASLSAGAWVRLSIGATPFLLPLFYQIAFGMSTIEASTFLFAYFVGNFGMKAVATRVIRHFGFRRVLVVNSVLCGLSIAGCALFAPDTPRLVMWIWLCLMGMTRSMQLTSLGTFTFVDVPPTGHSSASTLASMVQQIAMLLGVALPALALGLLQGVHHAAAPSFMDFRIVFVVFGLLGAIMSLRFMRLPPNAGAEFTR